MKRSIFPRTIVKATRYEVTIEAPGEYVMFFDGELDQYYTSAADAEHAAAMRIEEEARDIAAGLAGQAGVLV